MLKVYLAARYDRRDELREYRKILEKNYNVQVTSRWLDEKTSTNSQMGDESDAFYWETAQIDLMDIEAAHVFILFSENPLEGWKRGGRHVEFGYALKADKPVWVVGPKENVFHYRPRVQHFETFDEMVTKKIAN